MQGRGGEGGRRIAFLFGLGNLGHLVAARLKSRFQAGCDLFAGDVELTQALAPYVDQGGLELLAGRHTQAGGDGPVFLLDKGLDLLFPFADQSQGDRLDPARRQAVADLLPEEGGEVEADQIIQYRTGLLGIDQFSGDRTRVLNGVNDGVLGDFMEYDPLDLDAGLFLVQPQGRQQVPGNGFPFTVGVSCQQQSVGALEGLLDGIDMFLALGQHMVLGLEVIGDIHRTLFAGQGRGHGRRRPEPCSQVRGISRWFWPWRVIRR